MFYAIILALGVLCIYEQNSSLIITTPANFSAPILI